MDLPQRDNSKKSKEVIRRQPFAALQQEKRIKTSFDRKCGKMVKKEARKTKNGTTQSLEAE